ncbi:hypothetical protein HL42_6117 [Trichophyton rubrum]|nr:hypothetical protein HL42_6117 [Trichophyton rubrum]
MEVLFCFLAFSFWLFSSLRVALCRRLRLLLAVIRARLYLDAKAVSALKLRAWGLVHRAIMQDIDDIERTWKKQGEHREEQTKRPRPYRFPVSGTQRAPGPRERREEGHRAASQTTSAAPTTLHRPQLSSQKSCAIPLYRCDEPALARLSDSWWSSDLEPRTDLSRPPGTSKPQKPQKVGLTVTCASGSNINTSRLSPSDSEVLAGDYGDYKNDY